jgi:hypothetical protein
MLEGIKYNPLKNGSEYKRVMCEVKKRVRRHSVVCKFNGY